MVCDVI